MISPVFAAVNWAMAGGSNGVNGPQQSLGLRSDPRRLGPREFPGSLFLGREFLGLNLVDSIRHGILTLPW